MCVTASHAQTEQNRLDRSVQNDEKRPQSPEAAPASCPEPLKTAWLRDSRGHWVHKTLDLQAPSGNFGIKRLATWGMSAEEYVEISRKVLLSNNPNWRTNLEKVPTEFKPIDEISRAKPY